MPQSEDVSDNEMEIDETLSAESTRQREGQGSLGAFTQRTGDSDLIFMEGVLPEEGGDVLNDRSIEEQAEAAFDTLEEYLSSRQSKTLSDVMKIEVQLTDPGDAGVVDEVYESRFEGFDFPPRTVIGVCSLPGGADIQLDVIATDE